MDDQNFPNDGTVLSDTPTSTQQGVPAPDMTPSSDNFPPPPDAASGPVNPPVPDVSNMAPDLSQKPLDVSAPPAQTSSDLQPTPEMSRASDAASPPSEIPSPTSIDQPFVVPSQPAEKNPFIPQITPEANNQTPPPEATVAVSAPPPGSSNRRFLLVAIVLVILVVLGVGIKAIMGLGGVSLSGSVPVTINYWGLWEDDATLESVFTTFASAHKNVKITYTKQSPNEYRERLQAAIDRGDGPDVFRFHNTWVTMLHGELAPAPTDVITAPEFSQTFYPVASADLVGGQTIYGMPMEIDGLGLFYNEDLFASAGVTPPTTWEDLLNIVPKLTVKNGDTITTSAVALGTTGNIENFSDILATMFLQNGAKLSVPIGAQAEQALQFYKKFANPSDPVYSWNDSMDNSINAFAAGKVAMIFAPSWRVFDVKQQNAQLHFKVVPIPQLPGNTVTWASYWVEGVSSRSKNQELDWQFVKYMTSSDVVQKMYADESKNRLFGEPYARTDLASTLSADPYVGAYITEASTAKSFPLASRTFDNGINDKLIKYMGDAVNALGAGTAPTQALQTAANGFAQVLGSYGLTVSAPTTSP